VAEVDLLLFFDHSNIGKSTIQQNLNWFSSIRLQLRRRPGAGQAGELGEDRGQAGDEEGGVARPRPN
jgi:hypothetical protein